MFIVTPTLEARPSSFRSGTEWHFAPHSPPLVRSSAQSHAAPLELGGPSGICGYKHGAPKGAFCRVAVTSLTCRVNGTSAQSIHNYPCQFVKSVSVFAFFAFFAVKSTAEFRFSRWFPIRNRAKTSCQLSQGGNST